MIKKIQLGNILVEVTQKNIKNIHLTVQPPAGNVRISAPIRMDMNSIRVFAISKVEWIKQQQEKLKQQARETPREFLNLESHYVWGERYLLNVLETTLPIGVDLGHNTLHMRVPVGATSDKKQQILEEWYRSQIKQIASGHILKWEPLLGVKVERVTVQKMKGKWGSCNPSTKSIRLNTELAKKPLEFLDYIVLHEMVHLIHRTHNDAFTGTMDQFMPKWRIFREELNRLPLGAE